MDEQRKLMVDMARWQIWAETYAATIGNNCGADEAQENADEALKRFNERFGHAS